MMKLFGYVSVYKINYEYNNAHQEYSKNINSIRLQAYDKLGDSTIDANEFKAKLVEQEREEIKKLEQIEDFYMSILDKK